MKTFDVRLHSNANINGPHTTIDAASLWDAIDEAKNWAEGQNGFPSWDTLAVVDEDACTGVEIDLVSSEVTDI